MLIIAICILYSLFVLYISIRHTDYALAAFVPVTIFPVGVKFFSIDVVYLAIIMMSIGVIIKGKQNVNTINGIKECFIWYAIFVVFESLFTSLGNSFQYLLNMAGFLLGYIVIGGLFNNFNLQENHVKKFDNVICFTSAIVIIYAIFNYVTMSNPYQKYVSSVSDLSMDVSNIFQHHERGFLRGRVSSFFNHPLILGQWILLVFSYLVFKLQKNQIAMLIVVVVFFIVILLTGSRSSLFPFCLSVGIYLWAIKKHIKKLTIVLLLLLGTIGFIALPHEVKTTISTMITFWDEEKSHNEDVTGSSTSLREAQWESTKKILGEDILFGRGYGYVSHEGTKHKEMYGYESIIFTHIFDNGVVGFLFFIFIYMFMYYKLLKFAQRKYNRLRTHSLCLPLLLSGIMTNIAFPMFTVYVIFYIMTVFTIKNDENYIPKCISS